MFPGEGRIPCMNYFRTFLRLALPYMADPAQPLTPAGEELDAPPWIDMDRYITIRQSEL